MGIQDASEMF